MFCNGIVEKSDIIGAIFGQLDGLLPGSLNLQRLQQTQKIDRMQVDVSHENGKTKAWLRIPTTLPRVKLAVLAASLEQVNRVGPSKAETVVTEIKDTLEKQREEIIERASKILGRWDQMVTPRRSNLLAQVKEDAYHPKIVAIGKEKLPAGSGVKKSNEILVVEGRADVLNLLKYGYDNAIAIQGANIPETVRDMIEDKIATLFVDGDRSGFLITKEALTTTEVDYLAKAPHGKEVQDLSLKEIREALNREISVKSLKIDIENALTFEDIAPDRFFEQRERVKPIKERSEKLKKLRRIHDPKLRSKLFSILQQRNFTDKFAIYEYNKGQNSSLDIITEGNLSELDKSIKNRKDDDREKIVLVDEVNQKIINQCLSLNCKIIVGKNLGKIFKQPLSVKIDSIQE